MFIFKQYKKKPKIIYEFYDISSLLQYRVHVVFKPLSWILKEV